MYAEYPLSVSLVKISLTQKDKMTLCQKKFHVHW